MAEVFEADIMGLITVTLLDRSKFKFQFKSTTTSRELTRMVCEKVGLCQHEFFGLKRLRNPRTSVDEEVAAKLWLSEKIPLFAQGCDSSTVLFLRHKFWFFDSDELTDPMSLQFIFQEVDRRLMIDGYENTDDVNIQLAACRVHIAHGDFSPHLDYITDETIRYFLPSYIQGAHSIDDWNRLVSVFHQKHVGKSKQAVQMEYLQIAKDNTRQLQVTFFPAQFSTRDMTHKVEILVGVSPDGIGLYSNKKNQKILQVFHRFRDLSTWLINHLWNGQEAPDWEKPRRFSTSVLEFPTGPYRSAFFMKTKSNRTKDVEIELSSFLPEDDALGNFIETYIARFETHVQVLELDDLREHVLTISTMDGISKKIRIHPDTTGQDIVNTFAEKIGLQDTAFFQLSHLTDGADRWLQLKEPIMLQGLNEHSTVQLKIRFFFRNPVDIRDTTARFLYFVQLRSLIVSGDIPVSESDAITLAAMHLQTSVGDYNRKTIKSGFFYSTLKTYVPFYLSEFHSRAWWEKKIFTVHGKMRGLTKDEVVTNFLHVVTNLPNYGLSYFAGIIPKTEEDCVIGVSKYGLALFKQLNMELIASYRFGYELRSWSNDGEAIELRVKPSRNSDDRVVAIVSLQFADVIEMLSYYDKMRRFQRQMEMAHSGNDN